MSGFPASASRSWEPSRSRGEQFARGAPRGPVARAALGTGGPDRAGAAARLVREVPHCFRLVGAAAHANSILVRHRLAPTRGG